MSKKRSSSNPIPRREFLKLSMAGASAVGAVGAAAQAVQQPASERPVRRPAARPLAAARSRYNAEYFGPRLNRVAFPLGGLGAGMVCFEGTGALSHVSLRNKPEVFNEPCAFAALCVKGSPNVARVLEGPVPGWKLFGAPGSGNGASGASFGLPRFRRASFKARFPFGTVTLVDNAVPLQVELTGWSPFEPGDADNSSLPVAALEYRFTNKTNANVEAVFSFNARNFMAAAKGAQAVKTTPGGFVLSSATAGDSALGEAGFSAAVSDPAVKVNCAWFRGGWFDALTMAWKDISEGACFERPPVAEGAPSPGATLFVPFSVAPGSTKTIVLRLAWHVGQTSLRIGKNATPPISEIKELARSRSPESVKKLVGMLEDELSQVEGKGEFTTGLLPNGLVGMGAITPEGERRLAIVQELGKLNDKSAVPLLIRCLKDPERSILMVLPTGDKTYSYQVRDAAAEALKSITRLDFGNDPAKWQQWWRQDSLRLGKAADPAAAEQNKANYRPWYAGRFADIAAVSDYWRERYDQLRQNTQRFSDCFYDSTLPPEVLEAVAANLTILKSPTVLRQADGKLWAWEGCSDNSGCCHGSCTHVWNYAQAVPHLFPDLERSLRETEFGPSQDDKGHQQFRSALPIRPVAHDFHAAADGQLGGIMKVCREWRISGDTEWLRRLWPKVKASLDYCIATWDPGHKGWLEEPHHNTYDIEFWGPDGMCTSFYLGALTAAVAMGKALGEDVSAHAALLEQGTKKTETALFDGEYFIQQIEWKNLRAKNPLEVQSFAGDYSPEARALLEKEGPKYQYGKGCLSDGVLGSWLAAVCGAGQVLDPQKVASHLKAVHKYNLKRDLSAHPNPQRPSYACGAEGGLLLCTWPKGGELSLPFVYSNEVWTGIEYQAASHLMLMGLVDEGLEIVRVARDRYDGRVRNPFNEYECGHWYARAMSSYALLQGLAGARYDAVEKTLWLQPGVKGDFRSFFSAATGYGTVGVKDGKPFCEAKAGKIEVREIKYTAKG